MTLEEALALIGRRALLANHDVDMSWVGEVVGVVVEPSVIVDLPTGERVVLSIERVEIGEMLDDALGGPPL